jgi:hypothetical protein
MPRAEVCHELCFVAEHSVERDQVVCISSTRRKVSSSAGGVKPVAPNCSCSEYRAANWRAISYTRADKVVEFPLKHNAQRQLPRMLCQWETKHGDVGRSASTPITTKIWYAEVAGARARREWALIAAALGQPANRIYRPFVSIRLLLHPTHVSPCMR